MNEGNTGNRPLDGVRVLDAAGELGALAGKLLADQGADVLKIEPPGGDPGRQRVPFAGNEPGPERSLDFWHYNSSKRSVVLNLDDDADRDTFRRLAANADILLEAFPPGWLEERGLGPESLRSENPALVVTSLTGFGQTGPYRDHATSEIVGWAAGGYMSRCGDPDRPPLIGGVEPARQILGLTGAIGALAAAFRARQSGQGATIDLSQQETVVSLGEGVTIMYIHEGEIYRRNGSDYPLIIPMIIRPVTDGHVHVVAVTVGQWESLTTMLAIDGAEEDLFDPKWADPNTRRAARQHVLGVIDRWLENQTKVELVQCAQEEFRLPFAITAATEDAANDPQLAAIDFWVQVEQPEIGRTIPQAGPAFQMRGTTNRSIGRAPRLGEHQADIDRWLALPPRERPNSSPRSLPLEGIRVADFTWAYAGPWATRTLADLGADVVKIEQPEVGDLVRGVPPFAGGQKALNVSGYFFMANHNKRTTTLDLKDPAARDLARRLAVSADVVIDNFSAGVLDRLGLGPDTLHPLNPRLVIAKMPAFGDAGPRQKYVGFAPSIESFSGIANLTGWPDRGPTGMGTAIPDPWGGLNAAYAVLAGLMQREATGQGCVIEAPMVAAGATMLGVAFLDYFVNGQVAGPRGNAPIGRASAPHGAYPCSPRKSDGEPDRWLALAVETDAHWAALRHLMGDPEWAADPTLAGTDGRLARANEIDQRLGDWTRSFDARTLMDMLRSAGVPAGIVQDGRDLIEEDPHLQARGFFDRVPHPVMGNVIADRSPFVLDGDRVPLRHRPPLHGEHTDEVLAEWLGLAAAEIAELKSAGTIEAGTHL